MTNNKKQAIYQITAGLVVLVGMLALDRYASTTPAEDRELAKVQTLLSSPERASVDETFVYYLDARTGMFTRTEVNGPRTPVEPPPVPSVPCNGAHAGQSFGFWLCPSNVTQWTAQPWVWTGPPPLVPCSQSLRGEPRNGYVCSKDRATGRYRVWVPVQR